MEHLKLCVIKVTKISNIRKPLFRLFKEKKIEIKGYNNECTNFSYDCILLKKSNTNYINPIYLKGFLDNPMENNNYFEIQHIFSNVTEDINQIYYKEIKTLEKIMEKMPLKNSIKSNYIKPEKKI